MGGSIWHIDDVEAFKFDLRDVDEFALRYGYEVGTFMYYGYNCYDNDALHDVYPLLNQEQLGEFLDRTNPYEPLFDMFVIAKPNFEFWSKYCRNTPLRKLSYDDSGKRALRCEKIGTDSPMLLLRDIAFDPANYIIDNSDSECTNVESSVPPEVMDDSRWFMDKDNWDTELDQDIEDGIRQSENERLARNNVIAEENETNQQQFLKENEFEDW